MVGAGCCAIAAGIAVLGWSGLGGQQAANSSSEASSVQAASLSAAPQSDLAMVDRAQRGLEVRDPAPRRATDLSLPTLDFDKAISVSTAGELEAAQPRVVQPPVTDMEAFRLAGARVIPGLDGSFAAEAVYSGAGNQQLQLMTWTPTGTLQLFLPTGSITTDVEQATIAGKQAVLLTTSENVVERRGLYRAYLVSDGVAVSVEAIDFSEKDDFLGIVARVAEGMN